MAAAGCWCWLQYLSVSGLSSGGQYMIITNKSWHHCTTSLRSAMLHTAANLLSSQKHDFPNCVNSLTGPAVVQLSGETRWNIPSSPQVTLIADTGGHLARVHLLLQPGSWSNYPHCYHGPRWTVAAVTRWTCPRLLTSDVLPQKLQISFKLSLMSYNYECRARHVAQSRANNCNN